MAMLRATGGGARTESPAGIDGLRVACKRHLPRRTRIDVSTTVAAWRALLKRDGYGVGSDSVDGHANGNLSGPGQRCGQSRVDLILARVSGRRPRIGDRGRSAANDHPRPAGAGCRIES